MDHPSTISSPKSFPAAVSPSSASAAAAVSSPAASPSSSCRLAAVNQFILNPDEPQRSMQELVQALMEELEGGHKDLNRLYNIMMSYDLSGNEWKRYEFWDKQKKYTRNLIASVPGCFGLMLLCWNPSICSPIHNHAGSECFMRVVQGRVVERQYVVRGGEGDQTAQSSWNKLICSEQSPDDLQLSHQNVYETGGCTFINDSLGVHAVSNPDDQPAVTLHCYIPGYDTCKSWSEQMEEAGEGETKTDGEKKIKCFKVQTSHISYDTEQGEQTHQ